MADCPEEIYQRIPHRPPFLWVDKITGQSTDSIETEKDIPVDLDIFRGHYPDHPIMPGVILCEAIFQSGALLISNLMSNEGIPAGQVPVLTRIIGAKFKREVEPGDTINMRVKLKEKVGPAWFMKGRLQVAGKTAVQVEFSCAMVGE
ncbi:MAG: 3-hydroxyacyl-ACP dehydratase FabZ family protein [Thermodesulfobacteriota bacterium]